MSEPMDMLKSSMCVALRVCEFESLLPHHLFSVLDDETLDDDDGTTDALEGTTEWAAPWRNGRQLTFGLDFRFNPARKHVEARWTMLRTNAIVVDDQGIDQGKDCLRLCAASMLTRAHWEQAVLIQLNIESLH